jgi:hypothetical protein
MTRALPFTLCLVFSLGMGGGLAWGQGAGHGLNRGLGAAARGPVGGGVARSADVAARVSRPTGPTVESRGAGLSRAGIARETRGLRNLAMLPQAARGPNPGRIYDHRLQQADHLRALSARNGNESLLDTADRMERNATQNLERQVGVFESLPSDGGFSEAHLTPPPAFRSEVPQPIKRGFWIQPR